MYDADARRRSREELLAATDRLVAEFAGRLPPAQVVRCLSQCREELLRGGLRAGVVPVAELLAWIRLSARVPAHAAG